MIDSVESASNELRTNISSLNSKKEKAIYAQNQSLFDTSSTNSLLTKDDWQDPNTITLEQLTSPIDLRL